MRARGKHLLNWLRGVARKWSARWAEPVTIAAQPSFSARTSNHIRKIQDKLEIRGLGIHRGWANYRAGL